MHCIDDYDEDATNILGMIVTIKITINTIIRRILDEALAVWQLLFATQATVPRNITIATRITIITIIWWKTQRISV